jgi:predicted Zn finger-like uncharacterized protein
MRRGSRSLREQDVSFGHDGDPQADVPPGRVKITCHSCDSRYLVPEAKVRGRRFRATCKNCGGIIVARCDKGSFTVLPTRGDRPTPRPAVAMRLPSDDLKHDDAQWYVVIDDAPRGPMTEDEVRRRLEARRRTRPACGRPTGIPRPRDRGCIEGPRSGGGS